MVRYRIEGSQRIRSILCSSFLTLDLPLFIFGRKLRDMFKRYYSIEIRIVFTSFKISNNFPLKYLHFCEHTEKSLSEELLSFIVLYWGISYQTKFPSFSNTYTFKFRINPCHIHEQMSNQTLVYQADVQCTNHSAINTDQFSYMPQNPTFVMHFLQQTNATIQRFK